MNNTKRLTKIVALIFALVIIATVMAISVSAASAPKAPATISATQTTSSLTLSWSKVSGATGYRIYYKFPRDLEWRTALSSTTATSKTWNNLPAGETYIFAVRSYTKSGNTIVWGGNKQFTTATKPTAPKKIIASQTEDTIKLKWAEVKGATGYRVYYKTSATAAWKTATSSIDDNVATYPNLAAGKKYIFAVKPYIQTSSGVIWGSYLEFETATKPATPKKLVADADASDKTVTLSWDKVSNADGYKIYHREYGEEAWRNVVDFTTETKHVFKDVADGGYEYAVMAVMKTASGNICGYYRWVFVNMYTPTTGPSVDQPTTENKPVAMDVEIMEVGIDSSGRLFAAIDDNGWDGKFKSNSQRVSVFVDGVELESQVTLQISSSTTSDGYQYVYLDLSAYEINTAVSTIAFSIPEGFLENAKGTKYNIECTVVY